MSSVGPATLSVLCTTVSPARSTFSGTYRYCKFLSHGKTKLRSQHLNSVFDPKLEPFLLPSALRPELGLVGRDLAEGRAGFCSDSGRAIVQVLSSLPDSVHPFVSSCDSLSHRDLAGETRNRSLSVQQGEELAFLFFFSLCWTALAPPGDLWFGMFPGASSLKRYHLPPRKPPVRWFFFSHIFKFLNFRLFDFYFLKNF